MKFNQWRHATQIVSFIISNLGFNAMLKTGCIYPFFFCYGCPLALSACPIGILQQFAIFAKLPLLLIGSMGIYGTLFGRAFCGWACPFGAFQDVLAGFRKGKPKLRPFTFSKYIVLLIIVFLAWITLDTVFCKFCPSGSLFASIPAPFFYPSLGLGVFFYVHIATLILTVILVVLFSRFWCRYLCPVAPIGLFNKISVLTVSLDQEKCEECLACLDMCPMGIDKLTDIGSSSDCILCGRCVEACQNDALKIGARK